MKAAPLTKGDLGELQAWAESVIEDASGWAERAEATRGERSQMTGHLDAIASRARHVASMATVLVER